MLNGVTRYWWAVALRGLAAVLFGLAAFVWPGLTLFVLVLLFGAYALVDGVGSLVHAFGPDSNLRWLLVARGLAGIAAGIVTMAWPGITALVLLYLIAVWAIVTGVLEIVTAIQLRKVIANEWLLGLGGLASIIFGGILLFVPGGGALAMIWVIGSYALIVGVVLIALGFRLQAIGRHLEEAPRGGPTPAGGTPMRA